MKKNQSPFAALVFDGEYEEVPSMVQQWTQTGWTFLDEVPGSPDTDALFYKVPINSPVDEQTLLDSEEILILGEHGRKAFGVADTRAAAIRRRFWLNEWEVFDPYTGYIVRTTRSRLVARLMTAGRWGRRLDYARPGEGW